MFKKIITTLLGIGFIFIVSEANAKIETVCGSIEIDNSSISLHVYPPDEVLGDCPCFTDYLPISLTSYSSEFKSIDVKDGDIVCVKGDWEHEDSFYSRYDCLPGSEEDIELGGCCGSVSGAFLSYTLKSAPISIRVMELYSISSEQ